MKNMYRIMAIVTYSLAVVSNFNPKAGTLANAMVGSFTLMTLGFILSLKADAAETNEKLDGIVFEQAQALKLLGGENK